jgi:hypothetical protein
MRQRWKDLSAEPARGHSGHSRGHYHLCCLPWTIADLPHPALDLGRPVGNEAVLSGKNSSCATSPAWPAAEARGFLSVARPDPPYPAFVLLILYGLRRGEALGLR